MVDFTLDRDSCPINPDPRDPFGGDATTQTPPGCDWPPRDPAQMAALERWASLKEREHAERFGNSMRQEG